MRDKVSLIPSLKGLEGTRLHFRVPGTFYFAKCFLILVTLSESLNPNNMEKFDLSAALAAYRKEKNYTIRKMAEILGMSKSAYDRLERGITKPTYDQVPRILNLLQLEIDAVHIVTMEPVPLKWNRPRSIHLLIPVVFAIAFQSMMLGQRGFRESFGEDAIAAGNHVVPMFITGAVFCVIYWFFLPPKWPTRKPTRKELIYGFAGAAVYLMLSFYEELIQWAGPYFPEISAGPWIVLALIATLLSLCFWSFKKTIFQSIRNSLRKG